jgi:hypothetical protein
MTGSARYGWLDSDRHWLRWQTIVWLVAAVILIWHRWGMIHWYTLPDTDDNMRMAQVQALLNGQGWYDLRQHKLNPPTGFNIHWTRIVDLPIAAIELVTRPFVGGLVAQTIAAALAPLIPLWVALAGIGLVVRRLVAPAAFIIGGLICLIGCQATLLMFMPMRVDHHGWQLALLILTIAGLADDRRWRGGLTMGASSALSLSIGLELMPFLMIAGAAAVLRWVIDPREAQRLRGYALTLAGGCLLGYVAFASYDNAVARCDVLSPVWLTMMIAAGALALALSAYERVDWRWRLGAAAAGGLLLAGGFAGLFPQCLGRPEQISPELASSWFSHIREAKPLYAQSLTLILSYVTLPVIGVAGGVWATLRARGTDRFGAWFTVAIVAIISLLLLLWQTRQGPAAQMLAIPGATALIWHFTPRVWHGQSALMRTMGVAILALVTAAVSAPFSVGFLPRGAPPSARDRAIGRANNSCPTLPALRPIARLPATTIFTFVDLGPRLITVTHHRAVAGPYHRNGSAILDMHHAFDGTPQRARAIMRAHGATLLLTCPNMSESTVYRARSPAGFYARLARGERFNWLAPVPLPAGSPLLLWRLR